MLHILGLLLLAASAAPGAESPSTVRPASVPTTFTTLSPRTRAMLEAIRLQRDTKAQWQNLIAMMHQVAAILEKGDPEAAKAIAAAAQEAESALVADDMDRVIRLLERGLVLPADATQAVVIEKLRKVLETLRSGGDDLTARLIALEQLGRITEALRELLNRQYELEEQSRMITGAGAERLSKAAELAAQSKSLLQRQERILARTRALVVDPVAQQLAAAAKPLAALGARQDALVKSVSDPMPSPDTMAANIVLARDVAGEAAAARVAVRTILNDEAIAQAVADSDAKGDRDAAESCIDRSIAELRKCAQALAGDKLNEAQVAAAESKAQLQDAIGALERASGKLKGSRQTFDVLADLGKLAADVEALEPVMDKVAPVDEVVARVQSRPKTQGLVVRGFFAGSPPPRGEPKPREAAPAATQAVRVNIVGLAAAALRHVDKDTSANEQERALEVFKSWSDRLSQTADRLRRLRDDPNFARQQLQQMEVAGGIALIARDMNPATTRPSGTSAPLLPGECQVMLGKASEHAVLAADALEKQQSPDANREQNEVIRIIEEVIDLMDANVSRALAQLMEELVGQFVAYLERLLIVQKQISAETLTIWGKRLPDGKYKRAEELALVPLAGQQGSIATELDAMAQLMAIAKRSHAYVTFPPIVPVILKLVKTDAIDCRKSLLVQDAGPPVQRRQKDIEERLEGVLKAMRGAGDESVRPSPQGGDNGMGSVAAGKTDRNAEIQMLMLMQMQINRQTEELDQLRISGKGDPAAMPAQFAELARLQSEIARAIDAMLQEDLEIFAGLKKK
jgi:hypothetical protein